MVYGDLLQAEVESNSRCTWGWWLCELRDALGGRDGVNLEEVIEQVWRVTQRTWLSVFGDVEGGHDHANREAVIEWLWRCTLRLWFSKIGDALGSHERANLKEGIEWVWWCTLRLWLSKFQDALRCHDCANFVALIKWVLIYTRRSWSTELRDALSGLQLASLEMHMEAMIEQDWRRSWRRSMRGTPDADRSVLISEVSCNRGNVTRWRNLSALRESGLVAVDLIGRHTRSWIYMQGATHNCANEWKRDNLGWKLYSRCMLYSVLTHEYGMER